MPTLQAQNWVFTLNNPTEEETAKLRQFSDDPICRYLIFGFERGEVENTLHVQGYLVLKSPAKKSLVWCKRNVNERAHFEKAKGSHLQASNYCKKGEQSKEEWDAQKEGGPNFGLNARFEEFGQYVNSGQRSDISSAVDWIRDFAATNGFPPSDSEMAAGIPYQFFRYRKNCIEFAESIAPPPVLVKESPNSWQSALLNELMAEPDDRSILFYVDTEGNVGKTWFVKYMVTHHSDRVQVLGCAKRDDMAHMVRRDKDIFLINVPRGSMEFFQYSVVESLKDRIISSPKYDSCVKFLRKTPHVVVFCNEPPDMEKLSHDRIIIRDDF